MMPVQYRLWNETGKDPDAMRLIALWMVTRWHYEQVRWFGGRTARILRHQVRRLEAKMAEYADIDAPSLPVS